MAAGARLRLPLILSRHVIMQLGGGGAAATAAATATTTSTQQSCHVLRRNLFLSSNAHAADASETTTSDTAAADKEAFLKRWRSVAPSTQVEPGFPVQEADVAVAADTIPDALSLSLYLPHKIIFDKLKVESVLLPGTEGDFGVKPGHVPTIAQLRYGTSTQEVGDTYTYTRVHVRVCVYMERAGVHVYRVGEVIVRGCVISLLLSLSEP